MFTFAPLSNKLRQAKSNCNSPNNICTFLPFSKNKNTVFLHMISRRQTTQRTWKVQNLEQRLNHCGKIVNQQNINWLTKPQQYILQHQIIDLLKTNLPIKKMYVLYLFTSHLF